MKKYKVWIEIEEIDEGNDSYENLMEPVSVGGEFDTEEEAREFRAMIVSTFD